MTTGCLENGIDLVGENSGALFLEWLKDIW